MYSFKGEWVNNVSYSVGDVVVFSDGLVYWLQAPAAAGITCHDTLYWKRMSDDVTMVVQMINQALNTALGHALDGKIANNLTTTASGKVLDARQGKALKTLVDECATSEELTGVSNSLSGLNPDSKTIRLASSTASSTKVFDITVDDDGELTATEYTPPAES